MNCKTPKSLYEELNKEFNFDFDPCPTNPKFNGLKIPWGKRNFINPPYGRKIKSWIKKAYEEYLRGKLCVLLIPSRTDTRWWHEYIMKSTDIRFIKGRLKFSNYKNGAPFPSCVVVFSNGINREKQINQVLNNTYEVWKRYADIEDLK